MPAELPGVIERREARIKAEVPDDQVTSTLWTSDLAPSPFAERAPQNVSKFADIETFFDRVFAVDTGDELISGRK